MYEVGETITSQNLCKWISGCILLCYELMETPAPQNMRAHSTRAQAASWLLFRVLSWRWVEWLHEALCISLLDITIWYKLLQQMHPSIQQSCMVPCILLVNEYCLQVTHSGIAIGITTQKRKESYLSHSD